MDSVIRKILWSAMAALLCACGGGDSFRITGEIKDFGTQNLNVVYYANGAVHSTRTAAVDGKFMFDGVSRDWTVVYFFTNSRALLGMVIIKDGENVDLKIEPNNPAATVLDGTKPSELLGQWIAANADALKSNDPQALNEAVARFVEKNSDNIAATVVLTNYFNVKGNEARADSLFQLIDGKSRPAYMAEGWIERVEAAMDSSMFFLPEKISMLDIEDYVEEIDARKGTLVLYSPDVANRNSLTDTLLRRRLKKETMDSLNIRFYEIDRVTADTVTWKNAVRADSLKWMRLWHPVNSLALPWGQGETVIVADSTGSIVYNGPDVAVALKKAHL